MIFCKCLLLNRSTFMPVGQRREWGFSTFGFLFVAFLPADSTPKGKNLFPLDKCVLLSFKNKPNFGRTANKK